MAQFEYVSNNLTSDVDEFSVGKQKGVICQLCHDNDVQQPSFEWSDNNFPEHRTICVGVCGGGWEGRIISGPDKCPCVLFVCSLSNWSAHGDLLHRIHLAKQSAKTVSNFFLPCTLCLYPLELSIFRMTALECTGQEKLSRVHSLDLEPWKISGRETRVLRQRCHIVSSLAFSLNLPFH